MVVPCNTEVVAGVTAIPVSTVEFDAPQSVTAPGPLDLIMIEPLMMV
jgi:hypothetical protein